MRRTSAVLLPVALIVGTGSCEDTVVNVPQVATVSIDPAAPSLFQGDDLQLDAVLKDDQGRTLKNRDVVWSTDDGTIATVSASGLLHGTGVGGTRVHAASEGVTASASVQIPNRPPSASIVEPTGSEPVTTTASVRFRGSATDPEDGDLAGDALTWTSSVDGQIGVDTAFTTAGLTAGQHTIRMTATDAQGATSADSIELLVHEMPVAAITAPLDGSTFSEGEPITFHASAADAEDGPLSGPAVQWTSSLDGAFGTDTVVETADLSLGAHTIRMTATDSHGSAARDSISVTIGQNQPPTATILDPADGSTVDVGSDVVFHGSATDPEDGVLSGASLAWSSSLDGQIGTDTILTIATLSPGDHVIRLIATDSRGATGRDSVVLTVNTAPTVTIIAPAGGSVFTETNAVVFRGSASDAEDGTLAGTALEWVSSLDGPVGEDTTFTTSALSVGDHVMRLTATDASGATATDSILLTVQTAEATIAGAWTTWWQATGQRTTAGAWLSAAAFQHSSSAANFGMVQYSAIPRVATVNDTTDAFYEYLSFPYEMLTQAAWEASRGLRALLVNGVNLGAGDQERAVAFGKFVLGIAHGYLAMLYQAAPVVDENTVSRSSPTFYDFNTLLNAALGNLQEAITYAQGAAFTVPESWMWVSGGVSNDRLVQVAYSFEARIMAAVPRTPTDRAAADWNSILSAIYAGITTDLSYTFVSAAGRVNEPLWYELAGQPWSSASYFILPMADTSGNYLDWMTTALTDRVPYFNSDPNQPFLIHTPDGRFPQGATLQAQIASPGSRFMALDSASLAWSYPERGTWRWSYYRDVRDATATAYDGTSPDLTIEEMNLLAAEARFRSGDLTGAASIVNISRVAAGLPATDNTGSNSICVPRLPDGTCGDLWEMLKYEKRLVGSHNNGHMSAGWYFDSRGWGDLFEGTQLQFPIPCQDLTLLNMLPCYTFGGAGGDSSAPQSTYAFPGEG